MSCDIHCYAEKFENGKYVYTGKVDFHQSYGLFAWLAGVRNYSGIIPLSEPRGLPRHVSNEVKKKYISWDIDAHSASWFDIKELLAVDYSKVIEDRRVTKQIGPNYWDGGATAEPGGGNTMPLREFLDRTGYFHEMDKLVLSGADRIVFWFDN